MVILSRPLVCLRTVQLPIGCDWQLRIFMGSDPNIRSVGWMVSSEVQYADCPRHHLGSCGGQSAYDDTYSLTGL